MLQFLMEDIPRQIAKTGKDIAVFGTNCHMQDVIIAIALELGFIMPKQYCPTPTQGFPAAMELEISEQYAGNFDKINAMIRQKEADAKCMADFPQRRHPWVIFFLNSPWKSPWPKSVGILEKWNPGRNKRGLSLDYTRLPSSEIDFFRLN